MNEKIDKFLHDPTVEKAKAEIKEMLTLPKIHIDRQEISQEVNERRELFGMPLPDKNGVITAASLGLVVNILNLLWPSQTQFLIIWAPIFGALFAFFQERESPLRYRVNNSLSCLVLVILCEIIFLIPFLFIKL